MEVKSKNKIIGWIYKHHKVCVNKFTHDVINPLIEKLGAKRKK